SVELLANAKKVMTYTPAATAMFRSTGTSEIGTYGRVTAMYAAIAAAGHTAGQTASANARQSGSSTRRQPAGNSTKHDAAVIGTSVPIATPGRPIARASTTLSSRLTTAVATLV